MTAIALISSTTNANILGMLGRMIIYDRESTAPGDSPTIAGWALPQVWGQTNLTWSIPTTPGDADNDAGAATIPSGTYRTFSTVHEADARDALSFIEGVTGISLTQITETATVHGDISYFDSNGHNGGGETIVPTDGARNAVTGIGSGTAQGESGWVFITTDTNHGNPMNGDLTHQLGTAEHQIIGHETMHAFGLADITPSNYPVLEYWQVGTALDPKPLLDVSKNWYAYTNMSYSANAALAAAGGSVSGFNYIAEGNYAETPMMLDIQALQWAYGVDYTYNSTDTVYSWNSTTGAMSINGTAGEATNIGKVFRTIWDGAGNDTYDLSNFTGNQTIDLRPGEWTTFNAAQVADLSQNVTVNVYAGSGTTTPISAVAANTYMAPGNIANALLDPHNLSETASLIENAIGGSGNDSITGNDANNVLTGGAGSDTMRGGNGIDTSVFSLNRSAYTLDQTYSGWLGVVNAGTTDWNTSIELYKMGNGALYTDAHMRAGTVNALADAANFSMAHHTTTGLASHVTVDGEIATRYDFWAGNEGQLIYNGVAQGASVDVTVDAANLSLLSVNALAGGTIYVRAMDASGTWGGWGDFTITATANASPVVTAVNSTINVSGYHAYDVSDMFTQSDANSDAMPNNWLWSGSANMYLHGDKLANGVYDAMSAADKDDVWIFTDNATNTKSVYLSTSDGYASSNEAQTTINVTALSNAGNHAAVVSGSNVSVAHGDLSALSLFSVSDADAGASVQAYGVYDNAGGGHWSYHGTALSEGTVHNFRASEIGDLKYVGGQGTDTVQMVANDGFEWGSWKAITVTQPTNVVPTVSGAGTSNVSVGATADVSALLTIAGNSDGDTLRYRVKDDTTSDGSGHFDLHGKALSQNVWNEMSQSDMNDLNFISAYAAMNDTVHIQAFDGTVWSSDYSHTFHTV